MLRDPSDLPLFRALAAPDSAPTETPRPSGHRPAEVLPFPLGRHVGAAMVASRARQMPRGKAVAYLERYCRRWTAHRIVWGIPRAVAHHQGRELLSLLLESDELGRAIRGDA